MAWDGALIVAALKGTQLRVILLDATDHVVSEQSAVTDQGRLRVPVQGPDGDLYVATDANPGSILRVHPDGGSVS
jgi:glucose/arabinose dehydrogenase